MTSDAASRTWPAAQAIQPPLSDSQSAAAVDPSASPVTANPCKLVGRSALSASGLGTIGAATFSTSANPVTPR